MKDGQTTWRKSPLWKCNGCRKTFDAREILSKPSPFDEDDTLEACPRCLQVGGMKQLCEAEGCFDEANCGSPTPDGYKFTCGKHLPEIIADKTP